MIVRMASFMVTAPELPRAALVCSQCAEILSEITTSQSKVKGGRRACEACSPMPSPPKKVRR